MFKRERYTHLDLPRTWVKGILQMLIYSTLTCIRSVPIPITPARAAPSAPPHSRCRPPPVLLLALQPALLPLLAAARCRALRPGMMPRRGQLRGQQTWRRGGTGSPAMRDKGRVSVTGNAEPKEESASWPSYGWGMRRGGACPQVFCVLCVSDGGAELAWLVDLQRLPGAPAGDASAYLGRCAVWVRFIGILSKDVHRAH